MNSSFSIKNQPNLQIAWDATSLDLLKTCPRKYQLSILLGYTTHEQNIHLTFGILYHQAQDTFQMALSRGTDYDTAVKYVTKILMTMTWDSQLDRPWSSDHPNKNRFTLIRSFVWWTEQYRNDPIKTLVFDGRPAVELSFQFQSSYSANTGEPFIICGHLDRVVDLNSHIYIKDYKTTKYAIGTEFFEYYSPDNQMSLYSFAGQVIYNSRVEGVIIDAAQVMVEFTRFRRGFAPRTQDQLNEWYKELGEHWLPMAEWYAHHEHWPMNDTACGRYGGCQFRGICGKDPKVRDTWLKAGFKTRIWDPLKVRGDI